MRRRAGSQVGVKQQHSPGNDWGYQWASAVTSEAEPIESLLVSLVMAESPGAGGERWVMFPSDRVFLK